MEKPFLYKFGKKEHMLSLAHSGKLYLNVASEYDNEAVLSKGAHDPDELVIEQTLPQGGKLKRLDQTNGEVKEVLDIVSTEPFRVEAVTDYFVFCMSRKFNQNMFEEFDADTCVVITNPERFIEEVVKAVTKIFPEAGGLFNPVTYYSKKEFYTMEIDNLDIFFAKSDEYEHQDEFRFVCILPEPQMNLEPITIDIGNFLLDSYLIYKNSDV